MKISRIKAALSDLERELQSARSALRQIEAQYLGMQSLSGEIWEAPEEAVTAILNNIYDIYECLLVVLEAGELPQTRQRLLEKWSLFESHGGVGNTTLGREDYLESKPFEYVERLVNNLRILAGEGLDPRASYELAMLETLLRKTPVLLRNRRKTPQDEREIRDVMHDYLGAYFIEYRRNVNITGIVRDFKPDGGVRNLKAAIEFKFVSSPAEVSRAIGGIFEDISGYSGSLDWTRFYSVIYQTEAFESEDRIKSELTRAGPGKLCSLLDRAREGGNRARSPEAPNLEKQ